MEGLTTIDNSSALESSAPLPTEPIGDLADARTHRILIIEPDSEPQRSLRSRLAAAGFRVAVHHRGDDAHTAIDCHRPHLVMLDWDLPGVITVQLMRHARRSFGARSTRVIALSSFSSEQHVVSGFELGVDDYVVKPFSIGEVVARVRALLRPLRSAEERGDYLEFGPLRMDAGERRVTAQDRTIGLRGMEFRLLEFLMRHPERAFAREHLLDRVWGHDCPAGPRVVDVTIQRIRRALARHEFDRYLQTVRGVGYRLSASDHSD